MNSFAPSDLRQMMSEVLKSTPKFPPLSQNFTFDEVMHRSHWPWLELDLPVAHEAMYREAIALESQYVSHRISDAGPGYGHSGWKSLCIHGLSAKQTESFHSYGYASQEKTPYVWTEIAGQCPETVRFLKDVLPFENYWRVRFMLLEPGGYIAPHRDQKEPGFFAINIALNQPKECRFGMQGIGVLPFVPGSAILPDISNIHFVHNESKESRIHLIVHGISGKKQPRYEQLVMRSARLQSQKENLR